MTELSVESFLAQHDDLQPVIETVEEKNKLTEEFIESYYRKNGRYPSSYELTVLANWILAHDLKDKAKDKVKKHEYPHLSKSQQDRRSVEVAMDGVITDILHVKRKNNLSTAYKESRQVDY